MTKKVFNVGDMVTLTKSSRYGCVGSNDNPPHGIVGVVDKCRADGWVVVNWPEGSNDFPAIDLELVRAYSPKNFFVRHSNGTRINAVGVSFESAEKMAADFSGSTLQSGVRYIYEEKLVATVMTEVKVTSHTEML